MGTNLKLNKLRSLANPRRLSKFQMIAVMAIVAGIGTYLLITTHAATAPAGTYTDVYMPNNNYTSIDHYLTINQVTNLGTAPYFWSRQFAFSTGASGSGAYIGLQGINKAVFSVFGSSNSTSPGCVVSGSGFDGGTGSGTSCIINYTVIQGHTYHLSVRFGGQNSSGQIWSGYVTDTATNQEVNIGNITVPSSWGYLSSWSVSWTEYFGQAITDCSQLPYSNVTFFNYSANAGQYTQPDSHNDHISQTDCSSKSKITDNGTNSWTQEMGIGYQMPVSNYGFLDYASCEVIYGWAQNPNTPNTSLPIRLYIGGASGSGPKAITTTANTARNDSRNGHGFSIALPSQYKNTDAYGVWAYTVDPAGKEVLLKYDGGGTMTDHGNIGPCSRPTPPGPPTNLRINSRNTNSITLQWDYSTGQIPSGYAVFRNGQQIGTTTPDVAGFIDKGLSSNTSYTYYVEAFGASSNYSTASNTVTSKTCYTSLFLFNVCTN